ncbi:hypothetical protein RMATCC62417_04463 [Rhizopus microsporus]|nr:hypothetical protein RMATCC62417_04463 [Rhizopus microsporus]
MSENNLFQFAQVITELPLHTASQQHTDTPMSNYTQRYIHIRKNACIVCSKCFTCSKASIHYYGIDCNCPEVQPRRGKNLPEGGLDSRAKKLHRDDPDYEFSINWINENAHTMYKDENDTVIGLRDLSEVSLCKAHSSTLYRAKKRHERMLVTPPSPADSSIQYNPYPMNQSIGSGGLAAKVREISTQYNQVLPVQQQQQDVPDFTRMTPSHSAKRKRSSKPLIRKTGSKSTDLRHSARPHSSMSTPLFNSRMFVDNPMNGPINNQDFMQQVNQFPSQLPPLHTRNNNESNSNMLYNDHLKIQQQQQHQDMDYTNNNMATSNNNNNIPMVVETVSLRPSNSSDIPSNYYFRNLAITDTFTFRDLLNEIDITGSPPPGKRIVISDEHKIYPLDQAIRSVIRRPTSTHLDLFLGLTDKPSINWNHYS